MRLDQYNDPSHLLGHEMMKSKSWLARTLPVLLVLGGFNIFTNCWQTWSDFQATNLFAAQRLEVQTSLMASAVQMRLNVIDQAVDLLSHEIASSSLSDQSLVRITNANAKLLPQFAIAVIDQQGQVKAESSPLLTRDLPELSNLQLRASMAADNEAHAVIPYRNSMTLAVAKTIHAKTGVATIIMLLPLEQAIFNSDNFEIMPGTRMQVQDDNHVVIGFYPQSLNLYGGQVWKYAPLIPGPTDRTHYLISGFDHTQRLISSHKLIFGDSIWDIRVSFPVDQIRMSWRYGLYLSIGSMALLLLILGGVIVSSHFDNKVRSKMKSAIAMTSAIIENISSPVALVDHVTGEITGSNASMYAVFGSMAGKGGKFSHLLIDQDSWDCIRAAGYSSASAMLTRQGPAYMMIQCASIENSRTEGLSGLMLITLTDVSHQQEHLQRLQSEADFDVLTGLANRRAFTRAAATEVERAQQQRTPLALLMIDLDFFKRINDSFGHSAGDAVLNITAQRLKGLLRAVDLPVRFGGEEFAVILPDTTLEQALLAAERIRTVIANTPILLEGGQVVMLTVSIGVAMYREGETDLNSAQERADAALYCAKQTGRNQVRQENESTQMKKVLSTINSEIQSVTEV